jgi:hypothetical protein
VSRIAAAALAAIGCTAPIGDALVICHNANCAEAATLDGDDTLPALHDSLALRGPDGSVVFDGIELDSVWDRALGRCTFAHGPAHGSDGGPAALAEAAAVVAAHIASSPASAAGHGGTFYLKIELKTDVGGGAAHTAEEVAAHIACVTAAARVAIAAGAISSNLVVPIFDSDDPGLLAAIDPAELELPHGAGCLFETGWGARLPAGFVPQILTVGWYEASRRLAQDHHQRAEAQAERGTAAQVGLAIWARAPTAEDLYAMLLERPRYIVVNNVEDVRGLLDGPLAE